MRSTDRPSPRTAALGAYAAAGALRAGLELYRDFPENQHMRKKLPMPVLALAGEESNGPAETEMAREPPVTFAGVSRRIPATGCPRRTRITCRGGS